MFSKLGENFIKHNEHNFWKLLFIQPLSIDDIFSVISPDDIRSLRENQPANLGTIIYKVSLQFGNVRYIFHDDHGTYSIY